MPTRNQHLQTEPRIGRYAFIGRISDHVEHLLDAVSANRRRNPELGQVRPHRVRQLRALAAEDQADPMQHHRALLLGRLDADEAHGRSGHRVA